MRVKTLEDSDLIKFVKFSKNELYAGDSVVISPVLNRTLCDEDAMVSINGVPGSPQTLQFAEIGLKLIHIAVFTMREGYRRTVCQRTIEIEVAEPSDSSICEPFKPIVRAQQILRKDLTVEFRVKNASKIEDMTPTYVWTIGGDQTIVTQVPTLQYNYKNRLDSDESFSTFDVAVEVRVNGRIYSAVGQRTVSVWNRDVLNRLRGVVELETIGYPDIIRDGDFYTVNYELDNPIDESVKIDSRQVEFLTASESVPLNEPEPVEFSVPASGSIKRQFEIPIESIPDDMFGIGLHFFGGAESDFSVFGNVYGELRENPLAFPINDPRLIDILDNIDAGLEGGMLETPILIPELIEAVRQPADSCSSKYSAIQAAVDSIDSIDKETLVEAISGFPTNNEEEGMIFMSGEMSNVEHATAGDKCSPSQEPPEEGLACQLTDEYDLVRIPGRILNARTGDVILSPGSGSAIAQVLMQVDPMQIYSHCGIMTKDHKEMRHSTASSDWLGNQLAGEMIGGYEGSEGLEPRALKYIWPGTITQRIDDAVNGSKFLGPDGNEYELSGFTNKIVEHSNIGLVWPLVVKPDPRLEYEISRLRSILHNVASAAENIDAHYRLYGYTDASIFFDETYEAPIREGWWASGTKPTVCSSLIWAAVKSLSNEIFLEMEDEPLSVQDLEQDDKGAMVGDNTIDGLYFYTEEERKTAAQWLRHHFYIEALTTLREKVGILWDEVEFWTDLADDTANQITNAFAFDWTGENDEGTHSKDSRKWENPGSGNAVSPDDIGDYWDAPSLDDEQIEGLYGHSEKLVYRPGRLEKRRVRRWKRVEVEPEKATLQVDVFYDGGRLGYATVEVGGEVGITDENGNFDIKLQVPPESYTVWVHKNHNGWYLSQKVEVQLDPGKTETVAITLEKPPAFFRLIEISGSMKLLDDDYTGNPQTLYILKPTVERIGPNDKTAKFKWDKSVGGEVCCRMTFEVEWQPDASVKVRAYAGLYEGSSPHPHQRDELEDEGEIKFTVARDQAIGFECELTGPADSHAWIDGTFYNHQAKTS